VAALAGLDREFTPALGAGRQGVAGPIHELAVDQCGIRSRRQGRGDRAAQLPGGALAAPPQRRLPGGVGGRDDQAAEQAQVDEEVLALLCLDDRIGLGPEHVATEVARDDGDGEGRRRQPGDLAGRQQHAAADLDGGVDLRDGFGVGRDLRTHRVWQLLQPFEGGTGDIGGRLGAAQGGDALTDERCGQHGPGDSP